MTQKKYKLAVPHVYILLLAIILICSILTYIIPAGVYDTTEIGSRTVVDAATYHHVDPTPVTLMQFLTAVPRGMQETAQIIFFIFLVGGAMAVVTDTKAIEAGIGRLVRSMKHASWVMLPLVTVLISICGAVFGLAEETIPLIPIFVSICIAMGYDSMTGAAIVLCGTAAGFTGAFINPFTVQVAQGIAELPSLSGMEFRIVLYIFITLLTSAFILRYALRVKKDPQLSSMHEFDKTREDTMDLENLPDFGTKEIIVLLVFIGSVVLLVLGVFLYGWFMDEIAALFLGMSIVVGLVSGKGLNHYAAILGKGMADVTTGALVVGIARGILVVMTDGQILHTILHAVSGVLGSLPAMVAAVGMYIFQCLLNFLVPSGSGQASVSLPILVPLGDLVGVSRQTACIAFQIGDGISNIFTPTSGYFMAGLAMAKIPWAKWAKWILPLIGLQYLLGAVFVMIAQVINLGPY